MSSVWDFALSSSSWTNRLIDRRAGWVVEVEQDRRLVRIEQLPNADLRDGVVRNLPAAFAGATFHHQ